MNNPLGSLIGFDNYALKKQLNQRKIAFNTHMHKNPFEPKFFNSMKRSTQYLNLKNSSRYPYEDIGLIKEGQVFNKADFNEKQIFPASDKNTQRNFYSTNTRSSHFTVQRHQISRDMGINSSSRDLVNIIPCNNNHSNQQLDVYYPNLESKMG